jgi:hypothetical protein
MMPDGSFLLRDTLKAATPSCTTSNGDLVCKAPSIKDIRAKQLIYFAASIFWRAAAARWDLPLGHYEKPALPPALTRAERPSEKKLP